MTNVEPRKRLALHVPRTGENEMRGNLKERNYLEDLDVDGKVQV